MSGELQYGNNSLAGASQGFKEGKAKIIIEFLKGVLKTLFFPTLKPYFRRSLG